MRILCPHCQSTAFIRSSEQFSRVTREARCICKNPDCGHTFVIAVEAIRTLSPSAIPHPSVQLPQVVTGGAVAPLVPHQHA